MQQGDDSFKRLIKLTTSSKTDKKQKNKGMCTNDKHHE